MFTTKRKGIIALLCAVFAAALIACAISLAPSASRTAPVYAAEGDLQITEIVDANDSSKTYQTVEEAVVAGIEVIIDTAEDGSYKGYSSLYNAMWTSLTGRTLILLQDCETSYMKLSNNSIIDLNGHDLVYTGTATIPFNTSGITAAITDTSVSGTGRGGTLSITGEIDGSQSVFEIAGTTSATTLNVSNIKIDSTGSVFYPRGAAVLNITNCDITTSGVFCVSTNAGSQANYGVTINIAGSSLTAAAEDYDDCAVMMNVSGLLNIENSVITGDRQGLFVRAGDATVVGSEIIVTGKWAEGKGEGADQYYDDEAWQSGNEAPTAAFVIGNRNGTYFADANVSIDNSTISAPDGATAIYVDATTASQGTSEESYSSNVNITGSKTVVDGDIVNNTTGADSKSIDIAVLGGTFTADVEAYIPGDTILTQDDSGKIVEDEEKAESAVAEVDGVKYTSFESAIDAAADGDIVTLLGNVDITEAISYDGRSIGLCINKSLTINGNGYSITNASDTIQRFIWVINENSANTEADIDDVVVTFNNVNIVNSRLSGARAIETRSGDITLNLIGSTVDTSAAPEGNAQVITIGGSGSDIEINIDNSIVKANSKGYALISFNPAVINISNNSELSGFAALYLKGPDSSLGSFGSEITVTDSVLSSNGLSGATNTFGTIVFEQGGTELTIVDSQIIAATEAEDAEQAVILFSTGYYIGDDTNNISITGTDIVVEGNNATFVLENNNVDNETLIGAGSTINTSVSEEYIAEGSVFYPAEDGSYKVVTEEEFETVTDNAGVALMNGVVYDSLADAVDAAPTDGTQVTITLIDTDGDGIVTGSGVKVVEGKNIVIDFDGLTYDVTNPVGSPGTETNGFQLLKGSTVKMMNGTLVSDTAKILIQNYCDLTIDDMTLDMSDCGQVQYVISNNSGDTVITGDTTIVAAPNQVAFDIYYWPSNGYTDGVSVTFDKNFIGTVTGTVQYGTDSTGATEDNWQTNKANLAIENGTFDITFDVYSGDESDAGITVSGGEFSKEFDSAYVAEGSVLYTTDGDSFTVGTDDEAIDAGIAIIIDGIGYAEVPEGVVATVGAEGEVPAGYESLQDAIDAAADGETVKLLKNITVDGRVNIDKSLTLDMQGYEISGGMLYIKGGTTAGNSITVNISNGSVIGPTYGIIVFNDVTLNIKDVNISAGTHNGIFVPLKAYDGDTTVLPSTINIEGGSVSGGNTESTASVAICGVGDNSETATKLIANGTTFTGGTFGITGNGTAHNTYIELNDCVVTGSVGIYHPQDGDLIINGGEITGDVTGIEIRSGTLTVNSGTITGNGDPFESDPNGNGTTTTGAAIAVSQHTTNLPITVTINGGTFNGIRALYEVDLQDEVTEGVTIEVTGGTFNGEVYSENCTEFIAGGQFVVKPDDTYLAEGFSGFSEYNGMFVPVTSSTEGTMLEEIEQIRQEIADAIAEVNGALAGGDATTLAESMTKLIDRMSELEAMIGELDESMVTSADLAALRGSVTAAYTAAVSQVRAQLSAQIDDLREAIAGMGDVSAELEELRAAYEAADELLSADIADVSAELEAAISELESAYGEADDAIWNAIYALRDTDSGMTAALWVVGVIAVLALCAGVAGIALAIVRTKRS